MSAVISQCDGFSMSFSSFINLLNVSSLGERERETGRERLSISESDTLHFVYGPEYTVFDIRFNVNWVFIYTSFFYFFKMCMVKKIPSLI